MSPSTPRIICKAGPDLQHLSELKVNEGPLAIAGDDFEGAVAVRISSYHGPTGADSKSMPNSDFSHAGDTWSIQLEGRWKEEVEVDQVVSEGATESACEAQEMTRAGTERLQHTTDVRELLGEAHPGLSA